MFVGVESALWSLLLSLAICVAAVSVFTAHPMLLLPVLITILGKRLVTQKWILKWNIQAWVGIMCVMCGSLDQQKYISRINLTGCPLSVCCCSQNPIATGINNNLRACELHAENVKF